MTEERTYDEVMEEARRKISEVDAYFEHRQQTGERQKERQRQQDAKSLLQYAVPDFGAPMRRLRKEHVEAVEKLRGAGYKDAALSAKERQLSEKHRREKAREEEAVRDRVGSYLSRYRAIARVDDEPTDELRYARLEREFMARVESGRVPDLKSYWDAMESGDRDLIRVYEVHGSRYISDKGKQREFQAEIGTQQQARLSDEQKLARQRIREVEQRRDDFEMGLRLGAFGRDSHRTATGQPLDGNGDE